MEQRYRWRARPLLRFTNATSGVREERIQEQWAIINLRVRKRGLSTGVTTYGDKTRRRVARRSWPEEARALVFIPMPQPPACIFSATRYSRPSTLVTDTTIRTNLRIVPLSLSLSRAFSVPPSPRIITRGRRERVPFVIAELYLGRWLIRTIGTAVRGSGSAEERGGGDGYQRSGLGLASRPCLSVAPSSFKRIVMDGAARSNAPSNHPLSRDEGREKETSSSSPSLSRIASSLVLPSPSTLSLSSVPVCQSIDIRNTVRQFSRLKGCRLVEGFVQILLIDNAEPSEYTNISFPELREITGYLLLYRYPFPRRINNTARFIRSNIRIARMNRRGGGGGRGGSWQDSGTTVPFSN